MSLREKPQLSSGPMVKSSGFTVIELMAVVSIISILAVIALGAYQDYVVRSKVTEGLAFAAEAKTSVSEHYYSRNFMPSDNYQAGLPAPNDYSQYNYVESLDIITVGSQGGVIEIKLSISELGANNILYLMPSTVDFPVGWKCQPAPVNGVDSSRLPPVCRSN